MEGEEKSVHTIHAQEILKGPVEYPEATRKDRIKAKTYSIHEILAFKKLPSYSQPKWMDSLVQKGVIPPVEKRLPEEPYVALASGMSEGPGVYGGQWRDVWASALEGWNWGAGLGQSWNIAEIVQQGLLSSALIYQRNDTLLPLPNLAKSWEWSEDGHKLTMHLIRGAKWSDGHAFTSDDVMYTWHHCILDDKVNFRMNRSSWQIDGRDVRLRALDKYTIEWTFPAPFPVQMLFLMDEYDFAVSPAHVFKKYHPRYNKNMDYMAFENCMPPESLPPVTLGPWVPVMYSERGFDGVKRAMAMLANPADHSCFENPNPFVELLKQQSRPDASFNFNWGPETMGWSLVMNLSLNLGVKDEHDLEMRKLFRDVRFRRAVSHALDRQGLCTIMMRGPYLRPWAGGIYPGSPYYDRKAVAYYPFSPATSKSLFADMGFRDRDGDGYLNWTSGPLAGEDLTVLLVTGVSSKAAIELSEALIPLFKNVGIKLNFRPLQEAFIQKLSETGKWEMRVVRLGMEYVVPIAYSNSLAPVRKNAPLMHRQGREERVFMDFEKELIDLIYRFDREPDMQKRMALMKDYNRIYTRNLYTIGMVLGSYGLGMARRFHNVPVGAPPFLYQWSEYNVRSHQIWVAPGDQLKQIMPGVIPVYSR
jgi:peptide/nickel transport system substrate-binding protein